MKARKKLIVAMALLLATSGSAFALGLGQIKVKSALNQPLVAEIPVISATAAELRGLKVSLASSEDFQRAGISRARLETALKFKVEKRAGSTVIVVTSEEPVSDPALDLLLELNWSSGKLLREYSVLLDPPGMPAAHASQVATTSAAPDSKPAPGKKTAKATTPKSAPSKAATESVASTSRAVPTSTVAPSIEMGGSYTARAGDSVWSVAKRATSRAGNINRMMLAIQRANPDAFYKDNINALKKGAVLRIPDRSAMDQIAVSEARAEVHQQNQIWSNPQAASPSMMAGNSRAPAAPRTGATARSDSRLELVPPGGSDSSGSGRTGVAGGSGQAAVAGLKQELSRTKESLASEKQRSDDMSARVKDLENIRDKNQRLLEMKNAQIAQLQERLAKANAADSNETGPVASETSEPLRKDIFEPGQSSSVATVTAPASAASLATAAGAGSAALAVAGSAPANAASSETAPEAAMATSAAMPAVATAATTQEPAAATVSPEQTPARVEATEPPEPAAQPWYMQTWAWIVGGLVLLALILFGFLGRRGKSGAARQDRLSGALSGDDEDSAEGLVDDSDDEYALLEEIEQHPDELSLHLELASLYYAHRNQEKFEGAAEAMYAQVDDPEQPEWQQVRAMGEELCPDHPLFAELHSDGHGADEHGSALADMVSEGDTDGVDSTDARGGGDARGYNFDFNLTPGGADDHDADAVADTASPEDTPTTADEDEDLLSLSTLDSDASADDQEEVELEDEFDIDQFESDAEPEKSEAAVAEEADLSGEDTSTETSDDEFSSDPVDTKLDLARAYQDMGDDEGARAMAEEVLQEGSESQKDAARKLLDDLG